MKLGRNLNIFKQGYSRYGDEKYEKLKGFGFDCCDFQLADTSSLFYTLPETEAIEMIKREAKLAQDAGISISQVHGPWDAPIPDGTAEGRDRRLGECMRSVRLTAEAGCKYFVIHPVMPFGRHDLETPEKIRETRDINLDYFGRLLQEAKRVGVVICYENMPMPQFSIATPSDILGIAEEINDENFAVCLDTGHVATFPELNIGDEVRRLKNKLKVLHVHDSVAGKDLHLFPYRGELDFPGFMRALRDVAFDGVLSFEIASHFGEPTEIFEQKERDLVALGRQLLSL